MNVVEHAIKQFLAGRIWHREHIPFLPEEIDPLIGRGIIRIVQGVTTSVTIWGRKIYHCQRCHNKRYFTIFACLRCEKPCAYCRVCLKMGRVSSCTELLVWNGDPLQFPTEHTLYWHSQLTDLQQQAAEQIIMSNEQQKSHLLYAVCGSGKTEVLFQPVFSCLQKGQRVCIAAPRVDVILELEPRLKEAFPHTTVDALYGRKKNPLYEAQLILATTHQLYRFQEAFDVIFIDEADAFPYTADITLQKAVQKAAKQHAPLHLVTATPTEKQIRQAKQVKAISMIPKRYHGFPLPEPIFRSLWHYPSRIRQGRLPTKLRQWVQQCLDEDTPFLLFFHDISLMYQTLPLIQQLDPTIKAVHAADEERKRSVLQLREGEIRGLLTTTILERGITIANVQVAVIGAEQSIFTRGALIQIGGRVGRSQLAPTGRFTLFHHGVTTAMIESKAEIKRLNKRGGFHGSLFNM